MVKANSSGLGNCYVPAAAAGTTTTTSSLSSLPLSSVVQQRSCGDESNDTPLPSRGPVALRRLVLETSVLSQATGSALVEWGHTKVLCQVHGPMSANESSNSSNNNNNSMDEGVLACQVRLAPNLGMGVERMVATQVTSLDQYHTATLLLSTGKQSNVVMARETHLASQLYTALASAVPLSSYPKCHIVVNVVVINDHGNLFSACIAAASLALADACIEMNDLVTCCRVALIQQQQPLSTSKDDDWILLADPDLAEEDTSAAMVTLCLLPNWKQVTLWEQSGRMSTAQLQQAMELCRDGCRTLHRLMRTSLTTELESLSLS